jgi:hypothetical protein
MSEESTTADLVELTRHAIDIWRRHDLDGVMGFFVAEAVFDLSDMAMGTFEGAAAIRIFLADWLGTWGDHLAELEEIVDLSHGAVFVRAREVVRLSGSDGRVEQRRGWVYAWVDRKIETFTGYLDVDNARAAAERLAEERR